MCIRDRLELGRAVSGVEVHAANRLRSWAMETLDGIFRTHGLSAIVTPTTGTTAPPLPAGATSDGESNTALVMQLVKHIFLANLLGLPAISVPVGLGGVSRLPVGLQLIGSWWEEATLLQLAGALEADEAIPRPGVFHSELDRLLDVGT